MSRSDNEIESLRAETIRLKALLSKHGIDWQLPEVAPSALAPMVPAPVPHRQLSTDERIALFRRLFQGRSDTYPVRWVSKKSGQSGYGPACANEWVSGVCEKPRIKCSDCNQRALIALSDTTIFEHLTGKKTAGVYPLLLDDCCYFLAVDFLMGRNGVRTSLLLFTRVKALACQRPLRSPVLAMVLTFGSFSTTRCRPSRLDGLALR